MSQQNKESDELAGARAPDVGRPTGAFVDNIARSHGVRHLAGGGWYGEALPSWHVAAAGGPHDCRVGRVARLGAMLVVATAMLTVSVVYCQMHYAVDASPAWPSARWRPSSG